MDGMSALPLFLAAAEDQSFTSAARRLGVAPSAVGKAIARLEARLGVMLFQRTTRKVSLTEAGQLLFQHASQIREEWREAEATLAEVKAEPRGSLRIALPAIGHRLLAAHLAAFARAYPRIELDLDQDDRIVDLASANINVAIRSGSMRDSAYRSRKLGHFTFLLCAAPSYLARNGTPESVEQLRSHAQIRFRFPGSARLQPWRFASDRKITGRPAFVSTNMEGVMAAALAGLGVAQMPNFLAAQSLAAGELVTLLDDEAVTDSFWLVWPQALHRSPKLRAFLDFFVGRLLPRA